MEHAEEISFPYRVSRRNNFTGANDKKDDLPVEVKYSGL
mgnify:CR=1 FL=1